ncbi:MAG: pyrrolidone-carboxylate peptidase [Thermoprotei archaeon]
MPGDIVLFGFKPFKEYVENPSEIICNMLSGATIGSHRVYTKVLDVKYSTVKPEIIGALDSARPILVLGLGLAPGRAQVSVEKVAINYRDPNLLDVAGEKPDSEKIEQGGPAAYETNLPVEKILAALRGAGIPAKLSLSAGSYLCNNAMYLICSEASKRGFLGGFIHIPCHEELAAKLEGETPSMNINTMRKAVEIAAQTALDTRIRLEA